MRKPFVLLGLCAVLALPQTRAGDWFKMSAPDANWLLLTCSSDGTRLAGASYYGQIHTSADSGVTWQPTPAPSGMWQGLAGSSEGTRMAAIAAFATHPRLSADSGTNWSDGGPLESRPWSAMCGSRDLQRLALASHESGLIYLSTNGGVGWVASSAPRKNWRSLAASADGRFLLAGADPGPGFTGRGGIYVSTNFGSSWQASSAPDLPWQCLTVSADAQRMVAGAYGGYLFYSTNSGMDWTQANAPSNRWSAVACSADGKTMVAAPWQDQIHISHDAGVNWRPLESPVGNWQSIACSADASFIVAGQWEGGIYTWSPPPVLDLSVSASGVVITWYSKRGSYTLQETSSLFTPSWSDVQAVPVASDGYFKVDLGRPSGQKWYRLVSR